MDRKYKKAAQFLSVWERKLMIKVIMGSEITLSLRNFFTNRQKVKKIVRRSAKMSLRSNRVN